MIMTNKLLPVALVAALIGGSVGAFVMHSRSSAPVSQTTAQETARPTDAQYAQYQPTLASRDNLASRDSYVPAEFTTATEQTAYKSGFADGVQACQGGVAGYQSVAPTQSRVVYRNSGRSYARNSTATRRVYYDYQTQPRKRSFWQKHRDKLTVAMGAGGGAIVGGLIGGKKGAAIGALAGGGGSALYTYKLRNRNRRY
jgi:hypothetical protein